MSTLEFNQALVSLEQYLKSFAYTYTKNLADAEDLTQETLLKAMRYRTSYAPQTNFKAWVFTIMKNTFINQYRRKQKIGNIFTDSSKLVYTNKTDKEESASLTFKNELEAKVESLETHFKVPFQLHVEGYKYEEIAQELAIPVGTVKSRIFLARKKLSTYLSDYNYLA